MSFLLIKFRYFYRILHGKYTLNKSDSELEIKNLKLELESMRKSILSEQIKSAELQNQIDLSLKERKLTWKERWNGKIRKF